LNITFDYQNYYYWGYATTFKNDSFGHVIISKKIDDDIYAFTFDVNVNNNNYNTYGKLIEHEDFMKNLSSKDINHSMLFNCKNNICIETKGFIKYKDINKNRIKVNFCEYHTFCNVEVTSTECDKANIAYYNTHTSKFILCVNDEKIKNQYNSLEINENELYLSLKNYDTMKYSLITSDSGGNIIAYSNEGIFFFILSYFIYIYIYKYIYIFNNNIISIFFLTI